MLQPRTGVGAAAGASPPRDSSRCCRKPFQWLGILLGIYSVTILTSFLLTVTWAQRSSASDAARNFLYVNINVPDVPKSSADLSITPSNVSFTGTNMKGVKYHVSLDLYADIDPENSKSHHTPRGVELVLRKKELKAEYWPRLLKETKKVHFLKTDFDKV